MHSSIVHLFILSSPCVCLCSSSSSCLIFLETNYGTLQEEKKLEGEQFRQRASHFLPSFLLTFMRTSSLSCRTSSSFFLMSLFYYLCFPASLLFFISFLLFSAHAIDVFMICCLFHIYHWDDWALNSLLSVFMTLFSILQRAICFVGKTVRPAGHSIPLSLHFVIKVINQELTLDMQFLLISVGWGHICAHQCIKEIQCGVCWLLTNQKTWNREEEERQDMCAHVCVCVRKGRGKEGDCSGFDGVRSVWMFALGMTFGLT